MKSILFAAAVAMSATGATTAAHAADAYELDTTHAQVVFQYTHLGFSTTFGMFSDITGTIEFDAEDPAASSVEVTFPVASLFTGDKGRTTHFLSADFFGADENPNVTFVSTGIEVTGDTTADIIGDLTVNGITKPVVLDTTLMQSGTHPMMNQPWLGFTATTTVLRSDFDMGMYAPYISDEVTVQISIEAMGGDSDS